MKNIYKDGMNDKKSLQMKLQHYEIRRKKKIELLLEQRERIIRSPPNVIHKTRDRYENPIVKEVEDKLEKKKIMDEVKADIKRKQIELKDKAFEKKMKDLEKQKEL